MAAGGVATPRTLAIWVALLIVYVVWGSTYLGIRIAVETLPPLVSAGLRFVAAGVVLAVILAFRGGLGRLRVSRRQLGSAALIGLLLLAGGNGGVVFAEAGGAGAGDGGAGGAGDGGYAVPSGVAALLVALVPPLVVLLRVVSGDRPRMSTLVGVGIGFVGLAALVIGGNESGGSGDGGSGGGGNGGVADGVPILGAMIVVGAATSWAVGSFFSRRVSLPADPFVATVYESIAGGLALVALGLARGENLDPGAVSASSWAALAYLTVAGSLVAFTAYVWLLQHAPISLTATYAYVNPAVAVALGALVVAEPVTPAIFVGGAIILVGVALVVSTERPRATDPARPADPAAAPGVRADPDRATDPAPAPDVKPVP
jgi:drug/metabolite transporter (DMT)-like permease